MKHAVLIWVITAVQVVTAALSTLQNQFKLPRINIQGHGACNLPCETAGIQSAILPELTGQEKKCGDSEATPKVFCRKERLHAVSSGSPCPVVEQTSSTTRT